MRNIIDYAETELRPFGKKPFSAVDSLVLSQFSYIYLDRVVPGLEPGLRPVRLRDCFLAEHFDEMLSPVRYPQNNHRLLSALTASPRFRDIKITFYINDFDIEAEKQFSAVTFILPDNTAYIAYRGTDDSLVGWKEDFMMAFINPVPSQAQAKAYLADVSLRLKGSSLILGGHSKGGNLAVYAAYTASPSVQDRILQVYDHDGPGFMTGMLDCDGYRRISDRILKTVPQSSIIGMLLEGNDKYTVVESSRIGVMQHDPFSWKLSGDDFITTEEVTDGAKYLNRTMRDWIGAMSEADRRRFTDMLFSVLDAGEANTFSEISAKWRYNSSAIFSAIKDSDPEMKKFIRLLIREFGSLMIHNLRIDKKVLPEKT